MGSMTTVFVNGLEFYGYHGVPDEEQAVGHRYRIDLTMQVDESACVTDSVVETVNYAGAAALVLSVATTNQYRTVERLGAVLCDRIFEDFERVKEVSVRIVKPMPPAPIIAAEAGVIITRTRHNLGA